MAPYRLRGARRTLLSVACICLGNACQSSDTPEGGEGPAAGGEEAWVEGLQEARRERAALTEQMQGLFRVSLEGHDGSLVELALANLSDRTVSEYGGLLHLRDSEGERVCTLWLSEQGTVPAGETARRRYDVEGAFATDATPPAELQGSWDPYRIVFAAGEVMAKPWPTQSWWPWCQSYLSRSQE